MEANQIISHDESIHKANLKAHEDRKAWRKRIENELTYRINKLATELKLKGRIIDEVFSVSNASIYEWLEQEGFSFSKKDISMDSFYDILDYLREQILIDEGQSVISLQGNIQDISQRILSKGNIQGKFFRDGNIGRSDWDVYYQKVREKEEKGCEYYKKIAMEILMDKQKIFLISEMSMRKGRIEEYINNLNVNIPNGEPKWRQITDYDLWCYVTYTEEKIKGIDVWCYYQDRLNFGEKNRQLHGLQQSIVNLSNNSTFELYSLFDFARKCHCMVVRENPNIPEPILDTKVSD